jgi:hypothetical protein
VTARRRFAFPTSLRSSGANVSGTAQKILHYFDHVAVRHNESCGAAMQRFRARMSWVREGLKDFL